MDTLFHVVINLYEGVDFFDKQGNMNPEVLKDLTEWHDSLEDRKNHEEEHLEDYVREHKKTGRVFRHIHINHGPDIEKAIEAVKSEVSKTNLSVINILPVSYPLNCWRMILTLSALCGHYQMRMRYSMSVIRCRSVFRTQ